MVPKTSPPPPSESPPPLAVTLSMRLWTSPSLNCDKFTEQLHTCMRVCIVRILYYIGVALSDLMLLESKCINLGIAFYSIMNDGQNSLNSGKEG